MYGWDGDTLALESSVHHGHTPTERTVHYAYERNSFVPLLQATRRQALQLARATDVKALMARNAGKYDIALDPLWNGEYDQEAEPFGKDEICFYQCDQLGTPQELTNHEGRVAWSAQYLAWGPAKEATSDAARKSGMRNPIRFQGQYEDVETGLRYSRYRYYDPDSARFLTQDPLGLRGGENLYSYVPNPTAWVDPLGLTAGKGGGPGRKPRTGKPNIDQRCNDGCRKWELNRYDKICEGHIPGVGHAKYFRDPKDGVWYSVDQTGHGGSAFKQFEQKGYALHHTFDLDDFGDRMGKHKGEAGKTVDLKSLKCKDSKP